jgi:hypothetical protein
MRTWLGRLILAAVLAVNCLRTGRQLAKTGLAVERFRLQPVDRRLIGVLGPPEELDQQIDRRIPPGDAVVFVVPASGDPGGPEGAFWFLNGRLAPRPAYYYRLAPGEKTVPVKWLEARAIRWLIWPGRKGGPRVLLWRAAS